MFVLFQCDLNPDEEYENMKRSSKLTEEDFPEKFRTVAQFYDAVDKVYCFLIKRKCRFTFGAIESIFTSCRSAVSFDRKLCHILAVLDPKNITLTSTQKSDQTGTEFELTFVVNSGTSQDQIKKRRKSLISGIISYLMSQRSWSTSLEDIPLPEVYVGGNVQSQDVKLQSTCDIHITDNTTGETEQLNLEETSSSGLDAVIATSSLLAKHLFADASASTAKRSLQDLGGASNIIEYLKLLSFYKDQVPSRMSICLHAAAAFTTSRKNNIRSVFSPWSGRS